jgi:predicted nuclease with TOPRIM domain
MQEINNYVPEIVMILALGLGGVALGLQRLFKVWKLTSVETGVVTLLYTELDRLSKQNITLTKELNNLQKEVISLNSELRNLVVENQRLHVEINSLTIELSQLQSLLNQKGLNQ